MVLVTPASNAARHLVGCVLVTPHTTLTRGNWTTYEYVLDALPSLEEVRVLCSVSGSERDQYEAWLGQLRVYPMAMQEPPAAVRDLRALTAWVPRSAEDAEQSIDVHVCWCNDARVPIAYCNVFAEAVLQGRAYVDSFHMKQLKRGARHTFTVQAVSTAGVAQDLAKAPQLTIDL